VRALLLALILAGLFGGAFLWQERHFAEIRAEQRTVEAEQDARAHPTESGTLEAGRAVLVVGTPSGADPVPRPQDPRAQEPQPSGTPTAEASDPDRPLSGQPLPEFQLEVQPGQTLSGLAHLHYGEHGSELLEALAAHNGLASVDALRAGAILRLPPIERLLPDRAPR